MLWEPTADVVEPNGKDGEVRAAASEAAARTDDVCWQSSALSTAGQKLHSNSGTNVQAKTSAGWKMAIIRTYFRLICGPKWEDHGCEVQTNAGKVQNQGNDICDQLASAS